MAQEKQEGEKPHLVSQAVDFEEQLQVLDPGQDGLLVFVYKGNQHLEPWQVVEKLRALVPGYRKTV